MARPIGSASKRCRRRCAPRSGQSGCLGSTGRSYRPAWHDRTPGSPPCFALLISQKKVHTIRPALWLIGKDVLLHVGKPEGTGHAVHSGKQNRPVDGVQSEQPGQRIPSDASPTRDSVELFLCRRNDLPGQKPQIVILAVGAGARVLKAGGLSQDTISWFQSRSLTATSVNSGQPAACVISYTLWPSAEKVLR